MNLRIVFLISERNRFLAAKSDAEVSGKQFKVVSEGGLRKGRNLPRSLASG
jgi:hypothetical protein